MGDAFRGEWIESAVQSVTQTATGRAQSHLLVAVVTGDVQRGEEDRILNVHEGSVLQEDVCCLA